MKRPYRNWLLEDIQQLRCDIVHIPFKELAVKWGVSHSALIGICFKYNITRPETVKIRHWTMREIKQLTDNYHLSTEELARMLNRSTGSIRGYKKRMNKLKQAA